jgi:hypothetical protein
LHRYFSLTTIGFENCLLLIFGADEIAAGDKIFLSMA